MFIRDAYEKHALALISGISVCTHKKESSERGFRKYFYCLSVWVTDSGNNS